MAEFMIGATYEELTNLEELEAPVTPPKSNYMPFAVTRRMEDGRLKGSGNPVAIWHFSLITLEERNQLKEFCDDASAEVYIRTKLNDDTYDDFSATLNWPEGIEDRWYGEKRDFTLMFTNLVPVEGS